MDETAKRSQRRESPPRGGWLSSFLGGDDARTAAQAARRRLIFAFAVAIALHEIAAGVFPWNRQPVPQPKESITIARVVRIEHRVPPTPRPTPRPTPKPTPKPIVHAKVIAETHVQPHVVNPGNPSQQHHIKRIASARPLIHTRYHSKPATIHVPMGGHGAGTSTKAKPATGGVGPGGTGTGESGTGEGTGGAPAAHEPCGFVNFVPLDKQTVDQATGRVWEYIEIEVHFPDGSTQAVPLDYPFYYPAKDQDPFVNDNLPDPAFQFPPADKRANEPALVQYVISHSDQEGITKLRDCPK